MKTDSDLVRPSAVRPASTPKWLPTFFRVRSAGARELDHHIISRPVDGFLAETQKIAPGSVAVTAHSPNRMEDSKASSGGTPRPCKATTMAPSRTPQPPTEIGSMEMSRTVGTT